MLSADSAIEIINPSVHRGGFRFVLFDFDGTLSLVREGWPEVMIPMMVDVLRDAGSPKTGDQLRRDVEDFVMRLNGRQTIYQMIQLAKEVTEVGGTPLDPLEYKQQYHARLWDRIKWRLEALRDGTKQPSDFTVPGTERFLEALSERGLRLYLASGTDLSYVRDEAVAIGVSHFFGSHIYGAVDDYQSFSKRMAIDRLLDQNQVPGRQLLGFGDGFVEIEEVKRAGGVAVGVASDEKRREGINEWKRNRLIEAGADIIIADYREANRLLEFLFDWDR